LGQSPAYSAGEMRKNNVKSAPIRGKSGYATLQRSLASVRADSRAPSLFQGVFRFVHCRCQKFLRNVHNLFTCVLVSASPAGLRLEIAFKIDKKKNEKKEFYFSSRTKLFLTRKEKRAFPREKNFGADLFVRCRGCSEAIDRFPSLSAPLPI